MDKQQLPKEQRNEKKTISKDLYRQLLHAIEAEPLQRELPEGFERVWINYPYPHQIIQRVRTRWR